MEAHCRGCDQILTGEERGQCDNCHIISRRRRIERLVDNNYHVVRRCRKDRCEFCIQSNGNTLKSLESFYCTRLHSIVDFQGTCIKFKWSTNAGDAVKYSEEVYDDSVDSVFDVLAGT